MDEIGKMIKQRRIECGMTQEELAEKLGYKSKSAINKIEVGINDLTQAKIVAFAKALNTTPAYLMGWTYDGDTKENKRLGDLKILIEYDRPNSLAALSRFVKYRRILKNLTEKKVADTLGIPLEDYLSFESESKDIGLELLERLVSFSGNNYYYLLGSIQSLLVAIDSIDEYKDNEKLKKEVLQKCIDKLINDPNIITIQDRE